MKYTHTNNPKHSLSFSVADFAVPKASFYPMYAWVWSSPVDEEGIRSRIDLYAECKVKQLYILPEPKEFRPTTMPTTMSPDYLTPEYFEIYRYALEYAREKGMQLWLYDEGGWPSGSACSQVLQKKPHLASRQLAVRPAASPYVPGERAVAGYCEGKRIAPGFVSDQPIEEYYMEYRPGYYPNMSDPEATDTFLKLTHEQYKKYIGHLFGKSMTAVFTDEPCTFRTGWYDGFEAKFQERYGYDLLDHLPLLMKDTTEEVTDADKQVRIDYTNLLAEVFAESFFLKIRKWCNENHLLFTGHLNGEDQTLHPHQGYYSVLRQLRCLDIPGIDTIWRQIFPGKKNHFFPRFASSAANQIGSPHTMSESYAIYGAGLTFAQMRYVMLYQMSRGINNINIMSSSYSYDGLFRKDARPGFASVLPTWRHLKAYNEYTARLSYLLSLGLPGISYAVYMPMHDLWAGGTHAQKAADAFDSIVYAMEELHCPMDLIDDDFLETALIRDGALCTGTAAYTTIVLPQNATLPETSRHVLERFADAGGKVLCSSDVHTLQPIADITGNKISVCKRVLENGSLYLLQNESEKEESFSVSFYEKGNLYELDARSGTLYRAETQNISLQSGDGKVYLITDANYPAKNRKAYTNGSIVIKDFAWKRVSSFVIGEETMEKHIWEEAFTPAKPGDWCTVLGADFSGEVLYQIEFDLEMIPESIEIDLGQVNYSCDLILNDQELTTLCFAPYTCTADKSILQKHNTLLVHVANTPANQYAAATFFDEIPAHIIGPYHRIARQFEGESLESGLMSPVIIRY